MDSAIGLIFFVFLTIIALSFFIVAQTTASQSIMKMRKKLDMERERAKENLLIRWLDSYHLLVTNTGRATILRYIYVHINGSRTPTYVRELTLNDTNLPAGSWSGTGVPLGEGESVKISLLNYVKPKMTCDHPDCTGFVTVYDDRGVGDLRWGNNPIAASLTDGYRGYSLRVDLDYDNWGIGHFQLPSNYNYTGCAWMRVINPRGSGSPWLLLKFQDFEFWVDPHSGRPRVIAKVTNGIELDQPDERIAPPDLWNYYCITTRRYWNGSAWLSEFFFLINGRIVDNETQINSGFQPNLNQIDLPQSTSMADEAWFDELFASPRYLSPAQVRKLVYGEIPEGLGPSDYSRFSFEDVSKRITAVDLVTDLGRVFSSEARAVSSQPTP